jgi:hypothetical protein
VGNEFTVKRPYHVKRGDIIISNGRYQEVDDVVHHAPGEHPHSPIKNDMAAVEIRAGGHSRWSGMGEGVNVSHNVYSDRHLIGLPALPLPLKENEGLMSRRDHFDEGSSS